MKTVFADTSYWIALSNNRDGLHQIAQQVSSSLDKTRIVTSEMVLAEFLNSLSNKGPQLRDCAVKIARSVMANPNVEVVPQTRDQFRRALDHFENRPDKKWALTDCASMQIMEQKSISEALTSDHHFKQAGYKILLKQ